jgi:7,8-dihydroneopterin aldolase/epimerase/oxygenase
MSDTIFIRGLTVHAYHGVMPHEAKVGQSFSLDLDLTIDLSQSTRSDRLAHTVSYDQVVETAREAFCAKPYKLIEAAAGAVVDAVLAKFSKITAVRITVHKPHAPIAATFDDVGISIFRSRKA